MSWPKNLGTSGDMHALPVNRKLKSTMIQIQDSENVIISQSGRLQLQKAPPGSLGMSVEGSSSPTKRYLRKPKRKLISGEDLQAIITKSLHARLKRSNERIEKVNITDDEASNPSGKNTPSSHPALTPLMSSLPNNLSPFDRGECESICWTQKYRPRAACEVLQAGREAFILRDWLQSLTVASVERGNESNKVPSSSAGSKSLARERLDALKPLRGKRKRKAKLEGFVVSSDEEADEMDEISGPESDEIMQPDFLPKRTVIRSGDLSASGGSSQTGKLTNAVVISGPHGCGKTAAVYAVAEEMGFEVFEINAGSRRSGKDVLERVGDMSQNHLVQRAVGSDASQLVDAIDNTPNEVLSGRQGTMDGFFKAKRKPAKKLGAKAKAPNTCQPQAQSQKQSLILLEEVDILFEEDKQFWPAILSLISQSKRPTILTCTDESCLPIDTLSLHAVLRFSTPPADIASDYLLLIAVNEGHVLQREAVEGLYKARRSDLRAAIMDLDFWCQMAVGDKKNGLEWIYQRWPPGTDHNEQGERLRVTSKGTYKYGMGWLNRDNIVDPSDENFSHEEALLEAWEQWGVDIDGWGNSFDLGSLEDTVENSTSRSKRLQSLCAFQTSSEALSAADIHPGLAMRFDSEIPLDASEFIYSDKTGNDFVEGYPLLHADSVTEYGSLSTHIALTTRYLALRTFLSSQTNSSVSKAFTSEKRLLDSIANRSTKSTSTPYLRRKFSAAFDPIASLPQVLLYSQGSLQYSELDGPFASLVTEVAPYIRTIISADLAIEQHRLQLSNLLSKSGRNGKKIRTTRAARSALEGTNRVNTRRERWFPGGVNSALVLKTGGDGWQEIASLYTAKEGGAAEGLSRPVSRQSSGLIDLTLSSSQ